MVGQNLENIDAEARREESKTRSPSLSCRRPTSFVSEAEMVSEAESRSSRENLFKGYASRQSDKNLSPMAEVLKCLMEEEYSGGKDTQLKNQIITGLASRGCHNGESGERMKEKGCQSTSLENGKEDICRSPDRTSLRDLRGWITIPKR
ncbi:hypothetical protein AAC387_Pa11g0636 [Persea americana]